MQHVCTFNVFDCYQQTGNFTFVSFVFVSVCGPFFPAVGTIFQNNTTLKEPNAPHGYQSLVIIGGSLVLGSMYELSLG